MGVYSNNRSNSIGNIQVEAAEGYCGEVGLQLAMIESYENDLAIFDGQIAQDFREAGMVLENASEEELFPVQESAIGGFLERLKQFFLKLWEKIKGIFRGFMAKLDSHLMKDSKAFHDKYSKVVYDKDLSKMKVKYSKPKGNPTDFGFDLTSASTPAKNKACFMVSAIAGSNPEKLMEDFDREEFITAILKDCATPSVDADSKDYAKEFHDACFEDEEEVDNASTIIHTVGNVLVSKNPVTGLKKANDSLEKAIADIIRSIDKSKGAVIKNLPGEEGKGFKQDTNVKSAYSISRGANEEKYKSGDEDKKYNTGHGNPRDIQKALNYMHQEATAIQSAIGMFTSCSMKETKFYVAQARRVFAAAVAYNPKSVKESALLVEAAQEAAEYEVMSDLESI